MPAANAMRRRCLTAGALALLVRPVHAEAQGMQAALRQFAAGAVPQPGRVQLELDEIVENGNTVPVTVSVDSPMTTSDHVRALALFTERNPAPEVAVFRLGPAAGLARVSTRMRLATSQQVVAAALMSDGSCWTASVQVLVAIAACVES